MGKKPKIAISLDKSLLDQIDSKVDKTCKHDQQKHGGGSSETVLIEHPDLAPEKKCNGLGRGTWAAECKQYGLIKELERLHGSDDNGHDDGRP